MFLYKYLKCGFIFLLMLLILLSTNKLSLAQENTKSKKELRKESRLKNKTDVSDSESILKTQKHSPHKATLYSMILPGMGQAYNKKYWKIPIVYAGFGVMVYFISTNSKEYKLFSEAYDYKSGLSSTIAEDNPYVDKYSAAQLKNARDIYRRNRDFSYIITGLWYILNIIDASVDAHLFEFEVSDDLSLKVEPDIKLHPQDYKPYTGLKISLKLPISKP